MVDGDVAHITVVSGRHAAGEAARERVELHDDTEPRMRGDPDDEHPDDGGIHVQLRIEAGKPWAGDAREAP